MHSRVNNVKSKYNPNHFEHVPFRTCDEMSLKTHQISIGVKQAQICNMFVYNTYYLNKIIDIKLSMRVSMGSAVQRK